MLQEYTNTVLEKKQIVTVFLLTHNREMYLREAIDSILRQRYDNFLLLILDNMSTDNTEQLVAEYADRDKRVFYVKRKSNKFFDNSTYAFSMCETKYIVLFHDDDIVKENYLSELLEIMENNEEYCAISPASETIDENSVVTGVYQSKSGDVEYFDSNYFRSHFAKSGPTMIYPAVMYRTEFYKDYKLFLQPKAGPALDQLVWFQTERYNGKMFFYNKVLFQYRNHSTQYSEKNRFFMGLDLINYLLEDDYYKSKIMEIKHILVKYIWKSFLGISLNYYKSYISAEKYKSFFKYSCVIIMNKSLGWKGMFYVALEKVLCLFRNPMKLVYKIVRRLR